MASIWVGRCVQRPFFEEVTEESLERFVNKYVKRLGLWIDTTIHSLLKCLMMDGGITPKAQPLDILINKVSRDSSVTSSKNGR